MGRIEATIRVENLEDVLKASRGEMDAVRVRAVELGALVDTGARLLCLSPDIIAKLGLGLLGTRTALTSAGPVERRVFRGAQLTILGRTCTVNVMELSDGIPALVGYIALETLDLVPDPQKRTVVPNPEHGDKMAVELYTVS
ncbi:MAG: retropepsin-like domain-containing protein [Ignavibacteriae bacterium]|nr:retropepsin-like domain-containing protein [Ignavibacteriota bacterium]